MRVSPTTLRPGEESFLTIYVNGVVAGDLVTITFNGPGGQASVEPSAFGSGYIISYVPDEVMLVEGDYTVDVYVQRGELVQHYGPGFFSVDLPDVENPPLTLSVPDIVFAEATSLEGGPVTYEVSSSDGSPVTCTPPSGAIFPFGPSTVNCSASNALGQSATASFPVLVGDTTPPALFLPDPIVTDNRVVTYSATATDNLDPSPDVFCSPASGTTFNSAVTIVNCFAVDHHANYTFGSFSVTVTGGAPVLTMPLDFDVQATSSTGAIVDYVVTASENGVVACSPESGTAFVFGPTTVNCSASNGAGTTLGSFIVTVVDFVDPVLSLPDDITTAATSPAGAQVTFVVTAVDQVSGNVPVTCIPASGSTFPIGETTVDCFAADTRGNTGFGSFKVTVTNNPPPVLTVPADITREATGPGGATVTFTATATNDGVVVCTPASGSLFALGTTTVSCTATNIGGSDTETFKVIVVDTTAPDLTVPADITVEATSPAGATVTYVASATDIVDGNVAVTCVPASGSTFALGTTLVQCSAADTRGNTATDSFNVNVVDTTAPTITLVKPSVASLWPPNHKMELITVTVEATDIVDLTPTATIIGVTSNQPVNGTGDGDMAPDWNITGPLTVQLRSERAGSQDRIYTITVQVTDDSGNSATATTTVRVTQSRRR